MVLDPKTIRLTTRLQPCLNDTQPLEPAEVVIQELERVASLESKKVSDVVRDFIMAGLKGGGDNSAVIDYIESLGGLLMVLTHETVPASMTKQCPFASH